MDKKKRGSIKTPAVVGAILHLDYCCDLMDSKNIQKIKSYYEPMVKAYNAANRMLPQNSDLSNDLHKDKILRELDCAAIEFMHDNILKKVKIETIQKGFSDIKPFDSTRAVFIEGGPILNISKFLNFILKPENMNNNDHQRIMDLAAELQKKPLTKEEAIESLISAGIFDKNGNYTENYPHLADWERRNNARQE